MDRKPLKIELPLSQNIQGKITMIKYENIVFVYIRQVMKKDFQPFLDYGTIIATIPSGFFVNENFNIPFANIGWYSRDNIFIEMGHILHAGSSLEIIKPPNIHSVIINGNFIYHCL